MGFEWTQVHTQRLKDTNRSVYKKYVSPGNFYHFQRRKQTDWEHSFILGLFAKYFRQNKFNPWGPLPPVGGRPVVHSIEPDEQNIFYDLSDRNGHTIVLGTTRVGKTRFAEVLITQDIKRGDVVIVFDPKGDADLLLRMYTEAVRAGREKEFYCFHLGYPEILTTHVYILNISKLTYIMYIYFVYPVRNHV